MGYKSVPPLQGPNIKYIKRNKYETEKRTIYDNPKRCVFFRPVFKGEVSTINDLLVYISKERLHNVTFKLCFCKGYLNG